MTQANLGLLEPATTGAELSEDGLYRFLLWRPCFPEVRSGNRVLWVMLNPSTANARENDATIRKCIGFTKHWGFGHMEVVNLFAWRATDPKELRVVSVPVHSDNHLYIQEACARSNLTVVAWGNQGALLGQDKQVLDILRGPDGKREVWCLGTTRSGQPKHPGRLGYNTKLRLFR